MTLAAATALLHRIPATGCSAESLRQMTGWSMHAIEEALHQLVTAGLALRRDNRYLRQVNHPAPEAQLATELTPTPHLRLQIAPPAVTDEAPDPDDESQEIHVKHTCNRCDRDDLAASEMCIRNGKPSKLCKACFADAHKGKHATGAAARAVKPKKAPSPPPPPPPRDARGRDPAPAPPKVRSLQDVVQKHAQPHPRPAIAAAIEDLKALRAQIEQAITALESLA